MRVEHGHFKSLFKTFQAKQLNKMKEATGIGKYIHQLIPPATISTNSNTIPFTHNSQDGDAY